MPITDRVRLSATCVRALAGAALIALCIGIAPARATTYAPVTFKDLIDKADVIFVGDVVDVRPYVLRTREGSVIKTRVTFSVADPIYGTTSVVEVFDFLGGEMNGVGMTVAGIPKFKVGDHRIVFARNDRSINPIVGFTQGLLTVERDANGIERVLTLEGAPVSGPESIGMLARPARISRAASMRLADFRARIAGALAEAHKR